MLYQLNNLKQKIFYLKETLPWMKNIKLKKFIEKPQKNTRMINSFSTLKKLNFIEFPQTGLDELKVTNKITITRMYINDRLWILKTNNQNTLQSIMRHKKNSLLKNLGKADVTSHVNFRFSMNFQKKFRS